MAVRVIAQRAERIIVCGARNSSNTNRLCEVAANEGRQALLMQDPKDLTLSFIDGAAVIGLTAGASAPEDLVQEALARLAQLAPAHRGGGVRDPRGRAFRARGSVAARLSAGERFLNVPRRGGDQPEPVAAQPAPEHQRGHHRDGACEPDPGAPPMVPGQAGGCDKPNRINQRGES